MAKKGNPYRGYSGKFITGPSGNFNVPASGTTPEIRKAMNEVKKFMRKKGAHQKSHNKKYIKNILKGL